MSPPADAAGDASDAAVATAHREQWGRVLAATVRVVRDLDLAEECVQEAFAAALVSWRAGGVPDNPGAWLTTAARRRGVDAVRRERVLRAKLPLLVVPGEHVGDLGEDDADDGGSEGADLADEQLRLVFLCCHPALSVEAQAALTLRLVCGMSTQEVARAFLVPEATMAARVTRAKQKIAAARIPFAVPSARQLPERLDGVLTVVHLLLSAGHTAPAGPELVRLDLLERATHLVRVLLRLLPGQPEVVGLSALVQLTGARGSTRTGSDGLLLRLDEQDRSAWDRGAVEGARGQLASVVRDPRAGRYVLQALIALAHTEAPSVRQTDWPVVLGLYDQLLRVWPSPVVELSRAVAVAEVHGAEPALALVDALGAQGRLERHHLLHAVRGDLLTRLGRTPEADAAHRRALELSENDVESRHLRARLGDPA